MSSATLTAPSIYASSPFCSLPVALLVSRRVLCEVHVKYLQCRVMQRMATRLSNKALIKYQPATLFF